MMKPGTTTDIKSAVRDLKQHQTTTTTPSTATTTPSTATPTIMKSQPASAAPAVLANANTNAIKLDSRCKYPGFRLS